MHSLGNAGQLAAGSPPEVERTLAAKYGLLYGTYNLLEPVLTVSDAALLRDILVKDFRHWVNRRAVTSYHSAINNGLLFAEGASWRRLRAAASPNFTSGRLRRGVVPTLNRLVNELDGYFREVVERKGGVLDDTSDPFLGFAIETIAGTSFATATEGSSGEGAARSGNPFVSYGLQLPKVSALRSVAYFTLPGWANRVLGIEHPFNATATEWYTRAIREIIRRTREEKKREENDMVSGGGSHDKNLVQLLVEASVDAPPTSTTSSTSADDFDQLTASIEKGDRI